MRADAKLNFSMMIITQTREIAIAPSALAALRPAPKCDGFSGRTTQAQNAKAPQMRRSEAARAGRRLTTAHRRGAIGGDYSEGRHP